MLLAATRGASDAVSARTPAQQQNHIAGCGRLAAHGIGLDRSDHGTHLEAFGYVGGVIDFADMGGGQSYLVAVRGVARCGLAGDDPLRQFARKGVRHWGVDIARTGYAHGLIDVGTPRQRVTNGTA